MKKTLMSAVAVAANAATAMDSVIVFMMIS